MKNFLAYIFFTLMAVFAIMSALPREKKCLVHEFRPAPKANMNCIRSSYNHCQDLIYVCKEYEK